MSPIVHSSGTPAGLARTLDGLAAVAALLSCADERCWGSLARPHAAGLAVIISRLTEDCALEVDALVSDPPPG